MQEALAHAFERDEAEGLIEAHALWLGVGDDCDAAEAVALFDGEGEHVAKERAADAVALGARVDTQACQTQDGKRIGGQMFAEASARYARPFDGRRGDRGEADDSFADDGDVGHGEVQLELVLAGVVFEEAVEVVLSAREAAAVVVASERTNLNRLGHASACAGPRWAQVGSR